MITWHVFIISVSDCTTWLFLITLCHCFHWVMTCILGTMYNWNLFHFFDIPNMNVCPYKIISTFPSTEHDVVIRTELMQTEIGKALRCSQKADMCNIPGLVTYGTLLVFTCYDHSSVSLLVTISPFRFTIYLHLP